MRRFRLPLALLTIVGLIVLGALIYNRLAPDRWQPLPGGGEIRYMSVTYGQIVSGSTPKSFFEPLRTTLGPRWSGWLGPKPLITEMTFAEPGLVVWFTTRDDGGDRDRSFDSASFRLIGDNQQESFNWATTQCDGGSHRLIGLVFESATRLQPRLHVRLVRGARTIEFEFANPLYPEAKRLDPGSTMQERVAPKTDFPYAQAVPGRPGYIVSPFAPGSEAIDVRGYLSGTKFHCPYSRKVFLVP